MPLSLEGVSTPFSEDHEEKFGIPTLEDLGLDTSSLGPDLFPGGEQEALRRLDEHMQRTVLPQHLSVHIAESEITFCLSRYCF